jgi:cytochrome c oxidase assembly protein subunit 11
MTGRGDFLRRINRRLCSRLAVAALLMFGFGWALVPLYRSICEITGLNVLTAADPRAAELARNTQVDRSRTVLVDFDANRQGPWRFRPERRSVEVHPGELVRVDYEIANLEARATAGQAIPSYAPAVSGRYLHKVECFCFRQQELRAGETRHFPVVFFVDPKLPADIDEILLSYTFFEIPGGARSEASPASGGGRGT